MNAWSHHVSRGRAVHIKTVLRQTFANDVTTMPINRSFSPIGIAPMLRVHINLEFGDRGFRAPRGFQMSSLILKLELPLSKEIEHG